MSEMLVTISLMRPAFLMGSLPASSSSSPVLNRIKSEAFSSRNSFTSTGLFFLANESGSSSSGKSTILTFIPSSSIMSMPLKEALIPAGSPSYKMVMLVVYLFISLIWSEVRAVPDEATTFRNPAWCIEITSV